MRGFMTGVKKVGNSIPVMVILQIVIVILMGVIGFVGNRGFTKLDSVAEEVSTILIKQGKAETRMDYMERDITNNRKALLNITM